MKYGNFKIDLSLDGQDTAVYHLRSQGSRNSDRLDPYFPGNGIIEYNFGDYIFIKDKWEIRSDLIDYDFCIKYAFKI